MSGNKNLLILIFTIPLLIFVGILVFNINNSQFPLHNGQNQTNSSGIYNFTANEVPAFNFPSVAYASDLQKDVSIYNSAGEKMNADVTVSANKNGSSVQINKTQQFTPGKYSLVIDQNGKKIEQDFTWGVLAINPNKSSYKPGEIAKIALAVLDEKGKMVCDADVTLEIKDPSGQTTTLSVQNKTITVNPECKQKKYTINPDYETEYRVGSSGVYQMSLTAITKNGTYNIVDFFTVEENADFDVERITATRIFPYDIYPVSIKITANKDFSGQIRELTPSSLAITPLKNTVEYSSIQKKEGFQYILWNVSLKKGESINIGYNFKAPLVSPQFYLLGPLSLTSGNVLAFEEKRAWQLAIDAVSYSSTILADSPVGYWRLGEGSGTLIDEVGSANMASFGGITYNITGAINGDANTALTFNGTDAETTFTTPSSIGGNNARSIEGWIKTTSTATNHQWWGHGTGTTNQDFTAGMNNGWIYYFDHSQSHTFDYGTKYNDGQWHHIVFTYNGTTMYAYADGQQVGSSWNPATLNTAINTTNAHLGVWSGFWNGSIDEVAAYNVALTPTQIAEHFAAGQPYKAAVLSDGPIAYWRLGETSGTNADDLGSLANDGTHTGSPTLGVTGALTGDADTAVDFSGTGQYVNVPDNDAYSLIVNPTLSFELWFNPDTDGVVGTLLAKYGVAGNYEWFVRRNATNKLTVGVFTTAASPIAVADSTTAISAASGWHHLVATLNYTAGQLYLYLDGNTTPDGSDVTWSETPGNGTTPVTIGSLNAASQPFDGQVDEVAVYNYALSDATVLNHYNIGLATIDPYPQLIQNTSGLVAYWRLGESSGQVLDSSGNGHHSTSVNGTPTYGQTGALTGDSDTSMYFPSGATGWVVFGDDPAFDFGDVFSAEAWVKRDSATSTIRWLGWFNNYTGWGVGADSMDIIAWAPSSYWIQTNDQPLNDTEWHHVVVTKNGSDRHIYVDGVEHTNVATNTTPIANTDNSFAIGAHGDYDSATYKMVGLVDEVALYNVALSPETVLGHYNTGIGAMESTGNFRFEGLQMNGIRIN